MSNGSDMNNNDNKDGKLFNEVSHVIFDLDGLLIDSETIYEQIVSDIAKQYGKIYPDSTRMRILGTTEERSAEIVIEDLKLPLTMQEYLQQYNKLCNERFNAVKLLKGAEKLIRHLNANNIPFCLATSSSQTIVVKKTSGIPELIKMFHHIVCGSSDPEVKEGKPAPDIFLIAASRFEDKPNPEKCLVFEDSPNGVKAGIEAGMQTIMVPDPRVTPEQKKLATQFLSSLADFRPEEFGLPKFEE
ncbi:probable pseudouridine-5'-phosphatase [Condylostylus longicornis]|uniref:probable pseudouridine-5'-phosphatase n=1 Tax=Condylostylus longicornis TaxID=2530218 RepID=UPI00244E1D20|nr:probable pseudouridine-5'-phosphatase [Condylostylus longicornis]XP_055375220.1 probable pseudouridine-5'-phosphatase [Condylostylus longicornis]XP_055375221.1 probable pseudouridine-5'-phosphatase [Condylostylus longicornis]XP_055375222.1 probable pseudouridine-5'-phosphatase [Condylostylus longicornis]XP_055375223.1 probable pseudouridine-5'-phosphatase [Condylostylus longicornis]